VVELHYFGGLTCEGTAAAIGVFAARVDRERRWAKRGSTVNYSQPQEQPTTADHWQETRAPLLAAADLSSPVSQIRAGGWKISRPRVFRSHSVVLKVGCSSESVSQEWLAQGVLAWLRASRPPVRPKQPHSPCRLLLTH